jgi:very-short-patch-repair endonuclease
VVDELRIPTPIDHAVGRLATAQLGYVTHGQLIALGLDKPAIARRVKRGYFFRVHYGVYAVGHEPRDLRSQAMAAVLACGADAVLSHGSALCLWELWRVWESPFHVTAPVKHRRPRILTHRCAGLAEADRRHRFGIPVTSVARTLLDAAPRVHPRKLRRLFAQAQRRGLLDPREAFEVTERFSGHRGARRLRLLVIQAPGPTASELEAAFVDFVRRYDLPEPEVNRRHSGREVDARFPAERLIVELDGWEYHRDRQTFEDDRERDAQSLQQGEATLRLTWERLHHQPDREAARLRDILDQRRRLFGTS